MIKNNLLYILLLISSFTFSVSSQNSTYIDYDSPMNIPLLLSANFGELRPNHFHSGIDIKTQGKVDLSVHSIEDGYVSRILVSPAGYGLALYINHPNGQTSVYAHLNCFSPNIANFVKEEQYKQESYRVNLFPPVDLLIVKKGELIAKSGNTGSSFGPHLHFELRDTDNQEAIDPLLYYMNDVKDNIAPDIRGIAVYPIDAKGVVNNSLSAHIENINKKKGGEYSILANNIEAWGKIGIGVQAIDRMNDSNNIYGIKYLRLYCDEDNIFSYDMSNINFSTSKLINSFIDYKHWNKTKQYYMKSFIEPGNTLDIFKSKNNGYIEIDEERKYNFRYELEDFHGNTTDYRFTIDGVYKAFPKQDPCSLAMAWNIDNRYISDYFNLIISKDLLYTDINFVLKKENSDQYLSDIYTVHNEYVPLQDKAAMYIKINTDSINNKQQLGIISTTNGNRLRWIGGYYEDGYMKAEINNLGETYAIYFDEEAPIITPVKETEWSKSQIITIRVTDNLSGIKSYRGEIDGKFALFEHDSKTPTYIYKFDSERLNKGKKHALRFEVIDNCNNKSTYNFEFTY